MRSGLVLAAILAVALQKNLGNVADGGFVAFGGGDFHFDVGQASDLAAIDAAIAEVAALVERQQRAMDRINRH